MFKNFKPDTSDWSKWKIAKSANGFFVLVSMPIIAIESEASHE
jgi:hypothetical protein